MIKANALKYDIDNINTDVIWPGKYTYIQMPKEEMKKYAMETFDPEFKDKVKNHVLIVGKNFGCGSSREQASECLKYSGIKAIIAKSFARIFYRNSINIGLPVIESPELVNTIEDNDHIEIDLKNGNVTINETTVIPFPKYPKFVMDLINHDGLINMIREQNKE